MPYPYDQVFAADPATPENVASNGVVTIFAPGDPDRTPLTITTLDGLPLSNPMQVNDAGFGPAFMHATLDQVAWAGGGFSGLFVSYKGIKDEAVAARRAAGEAALEAQKPTDESVDRGIQRADIPGVVAGTVAADPRIAQAAADAAAVKDKALANDAGVASLLKTGDQTSAALGVAATAAAKTQDLLHAPLPYRGPMGILRAALTLIGTDSLVIGGRVNIGFTGSSTTAGHTTPVGDRWIDILAARVTANPVITDADAYNKTLPLGINFINAGVNGTNATNYLHGLRAERLASTKPRLIVHNIGSNDFINAYTLAEYEASIREVLTRMDTLVKTPVAHLLVHSYERYDFTPSAKKWDQYRDVLIKLALERPNNVVFLDLSETFRGLQISKGDPLGLMMADRIHMNNYGHHLYADLIDSALGIPHLGTAPAGATPPVAADSFARADGPLGATPIGGKAWTAGQGTVAIVGGKATATAVNSTSELPTGAGSTVETDFTDGVVTVGQTAGVNQGPLFRATAGGAGYYFMYSAAGVEYRVGTRNAAGGFTKLLGTGTAVAHAPTSKMTVELKGPSITCKLNGVTILEVTDSTFTGTRHGVVFADTGRSLDSFRFDAPAGT